MKCFHLVTVLALAPALVACDTYAEGASQTVAPAAAGSVTPVASNPAADPNASTPIAGSTMPDAGATPGPSVRSFGRVAAADDGSGLFDLNWGGSLIEVRSQSDGPGSLLVSLQNLSKESAPDGNAFAVLVDGSPTATPPLQAPPMQGGALAAPTSIQVAVPAGTHTVQLVKRTEGLHGTVRVGVAPGAGTTLLPTVVPSRRIEFIGDSISNGYGVEGSETHTPSSNINCKAVASTENAVDAYSALTARALHADYQITAYSGKGVYQNQPADTLATMPKVWTQTTALTDAPAWDFTAWVPDVVVILLGTNDFFTSATRPAVTQAQFVPAYTALVQDVRSRYPTAKIVLASSPMLATYNGASTALDAWLHQILASLGDANVSYLDLPTQSTLQTGCEYHPTVGSQRAVANLVTEHLGPLMDWN